ncbi:MAG: hypothetical protein HC831_16640, partial [Chloroflexia bacterium]|nr:hypothetical protein [Chloroflexia bacterium]
MTCDLFNNSNGNYVNPGLAPCAGSGENNNVEFVDKGIGIVNGSKIVTYMDFSNLSIPTKSWNQQTQSIGPGEVIFIPGLTKGLKLRRQGFRLPSLTSTNTIIDPFFFDIDLSVSYYNNFSYNQINIDASGNYNDNIDIVTALDKALENSLVKTTSSYDPSTLGFSGTQSGYQYTITNVYLNIIDASQNPESPFPSYVVNGQRVPQTYELLEDPTKNIPFAKYPNTASQGIILKTKYPSTDSAGNLICPADKWILINHAASNVDVYDPIELTFNTDVSCLVAMNYDGSTYLGST